MQDPEIVHYNGPLRYTVQRSRFSPYNVKQHVTVFGLDFIHCMFLKSLRILQITKFRRIDFFLIQVKSGRVQTSTVSDPTDRNNPGLSVFQDFVQRVMDKVQNKESIDISSRKIFIVQYGV
jgi:hypothetical protein